MAKTPEEILAEIRAKFNDKLRDYQVRNIADIMSRYTVRHHDAVNDAKANAAYMMFQEFQSQPRRGTVKNGFVGPMSGHSTQMRNYRTVNLDPSEWRRV